MKCRICDNEHLQKFLSLGKTPLANNFITEQQLHQQEETFPLELCFCDTCKLVQLSYVVPPEKMFKNYVYVSSTTKTFQIHFAKMAEDLTREFGLDGNSLVVDIGSNDGLLLKCFQKFGIKTIGVEPATNVSKIAEENGVETINDFFSKEVVNQIISRKGKVDLITANNVFAHINNIKDVLGNVKILLKKDGAFVIEFQYLVDTIEKMTFDNIYHEHLSYFTLTSISYLFSKHGMQVFKAERVDSHGGSLRVFMKAKDGRHKTDLSVIEILEYEKSIGVDNFETYKNFAQKVYSVREKLVKYIKDIKNKNKRIAAYGAPAKGNTLLNFCNIGASYIDYVVEDNPLKQGLFTPGTHIPVFSSRMLEENTPDYILILAWNFAQEIMSKTAAYKEMGVKFLIPLPEPVIV